MVLTDRCFDASIAYQGYARGVDIALIEQLSLLATQGYKPDLTILLDLDPQSRYTVELISHMIRVVRVKDEHDLMPKRKLFINVCKKDFMRSLEPILSVSRWSMPQEHLKRFTRRLSGWLRPCCKKYGLVQELL